MIMDTNVPSDIMYCSKLYNWEPSCSPKKKRIRLHDYYIALGYFEEYRELYDESESSHITDKTFYLPNLDATIKFKVDKYNLWRQFNVITLIQFNSIECVNVKFNLRCKSSNRGIKTITEYPTDFTNNRYKFTSKTISVYDARSESPYLGVGTKIQYVLHLSCYSLEDKSVPCIDHMESKILCIKKIADKYLTTMKEFNMKKYNRIIDYYLQQAPDLEM